MPLSTASLVLRIHLRSLRNFSHLPHRNLQRITTDRRTIEKSESTQGFSRARAIAFDGLGVGIGEVAVCEARRRSKERFEAARSVAGAEAQLVFVGVLRRDCYKAGFGAALAVAEDAHLPRDFKCDCPASPAIASFAQSLRGQSLLDDIHHRGARQVQVRFSNERDVYGKRIGHLHLDGAARRLASREA